MNNNLSILIRIINLNCIKLNSFFNEFGHINNHNIHFMILNVYNQIGDIFGYI